MMGWKELDILVFIDDPDSVPPKFHLECDDLPKGQKQDDYVFSNNGHDGFLLNYKLQDPTHGYFFPDDKHEALFSARGEACPTKKDQWEQFRAREVKAGNKILVVRNLNQKGHEGCFAYTLRVTQTPHVLDSNTRYLDLDPGGTNTNGQSRSNISLFSIAGVSVVTGVVSALATVGALSSLGLVCSSRGGL
jgi:hypothetical protein